MSQALEAREQTLLDVFSGRFCFTTPPYQRAYSWTQTEASRLLDDLWGWAEHREDHAERGADGSPPPYFLGALLMARSPDADQLLVVDGHQRLMTLTILLAVLRDLETAKDRRTALHDLIRRRGRVLVGHGAGWRMNTLARDADAFERIIQADGATRKRPSPGKTDPDTTDAPSPDVRMADAAQLFRTALISEPARKRRAFVKHILGDCHVAQLIVRDENAAFTMFETLNQRGLPLAAKDVLKSRLLGDVERGSERERTAAAAWTALETRFACEGRAGAVSGAAAGGDLFERFLTIVARAHDGDDGPPQKDLITRFMGAVGPQDTYVGLVEDVLPRYADAYAAVAPMAARTLFGDPIVDRYGAFLSWWEDEEWAGVATRTLVVHGEDPTLCGVILKHLERFAAVLALSGERKYRRVKDYRAALDWVDKPDALLREGGPLTPRPEHLRIVRARLEDPLPPEKAVRRAILARVNAALDPHGHPPVESRIGTIEHILPRAAQRTTGGDAYPGWTPTEARAVVETLGNLTLIDKEQNLLADRKPYSDKRRIYFPHADRLNPFALTEDLRLNGVDVWTREAWAARQRRLVDILVREWGLPEEAARAKRGAA